jgi:hypothetical protein
LSITHAAEAGKGGPTTIACINNARTGLGVPFDQLTATLQKCYDECFLPVWGHPVQLYNTDVATPTDRQLLYLDDGDTASALGYHDLTKNGQPVSCVFVKTTLANNQLVSVAASRELFQMVIDPAANLWAEAADGTEYAYEISDPVEEDTFLVDGIEMTNFVHPSWFQPFMHPPGTKFDHLGLLRAPFTMTKGGYVTVKKGDRVSEVFGSKAKERRFANEDRYGRRSEYRKSGGQRIRRPRTRLQSHRHQ